MHNKKFGVVSPSWNGPGKYEHVFQHGVSQIRALLGRDIVFSKNCICPQRPSFVERAADINEMFLNDEVELIIASIGGSDSINIIPLIDTDIVMRNSKSKIFMGFSDCTTLLVYLEKFGVRCIHGPSIMAGLSEPDGICAELSSHIKDIFLVNTEDAYIYPKFELYTDIDPDWSDKTIFLNTKIEYKKYTGHEVVTGGKFKGRLWGGSIETLIKILDSNFDQFKLSNDWGNTILFLETSEEKPTEEQLTGFIRRLYDLGILAKTQAILFGYFPYYEEDTKISIKNSLKKIICNELNYDGGFVFNLNFGHARPQWLLPYGETYTIDCDKGELILLQ